MSEIEKTPSKILKNNDDSYISNISNKSFTKEGSENKPSNENQNQNITPKKQTPKKTSPNEIQNQNITPKKQTPNKTSPKKPSPEKSTNEIQSQNITPKKQTPNKASSKKPSPEKSTNEIQNQNITPKKPSPKKNSPEKNERTPRKSLNKNLSKESFETPDKSNASKIKRLSPTVDESPMQKTKNLVDKWEIIKQDNEKLAKATQYDIEKNQKKSLPSSRNSSTLFTNYSTSENRMKDHIPKITKKFSMKEKRLRETIQTFNQSYNTANIDLKDMEKNIITKKPIIKEKRIYMEDENDEDKVQRSKRVKVSELSNNNTSIWHRFNSSIYSLKDIFNKQKSDIENSEDDNKNKANESVIITPTVKHQEVKEPVRLNEGTCLNIFNPSANKSTIPVFLRLLRRNSSNKEKSNALSVFAKSNTKPEWINKLYIVISNEDSIPKLFDIPVHWTSLSSQMVYILDICGEALIQFNGSKSLNRDKDYAQRICKRISLNDNVPDIFEVDQEDSYNNNSVPLKLFWKALELDNYTEEEREKIIIKNDNLNLNSILEKNKKKIDIEKAIYIYRINEQTHSLDLIHNGTFPTYRCLNTNTSMIFDFVGEVYLWQGKNSSLNARSKGIKFAEKIFNDYPRPSWANLRKINEGHEPILFQEKFKDSYLFF